MRDFLEGSEAVAEAVARCRPSVVPAYPITPQTHIVEGVGARIRDGRLPHCEFITVESEFAAMSAAIGASAAGARAYTATASQGLLYMAEALYNASGLGLPIVMTVANRAIGAPINIWNDHSDVMSQRDCGWIQVHARDNQEAVDLHVLAFRVAEAVSVPAMVCMDGFVLTHALEAVDVPEQDVVDGVLPAFRPRQVLDPYQPVTIGAMVGPADFTETRVLAHDALLDAEAEFATAALEWHERTGRTLASVSAHRVQGARVVVLAAGSAAGTVDDVVDEARAGGLPVGAATLTLVRPFPARALRQALSAAEHVVVLERAFAPGAGGVLAPEVHTALDGTGVRVSSAVAGLGGRPVSRATVRGVLDRALDGSLPAFGFADVHDDVVRHERGDWVSQEAYR